MPDASSPARQAAARTNGTLSRGPTTAGKARAARNGTCHGLRGSAFALLPGEVTSELEQLRQAVAADWHPRNAYERHWAAELVAALWRQQRLRRLEFAALDAAEAESPPSEASLKRLLTFARYGARVDGDMGRALKALRSLKARPDVDLSTSARTREPEPTTEPVSSPAARTPEPERPTAPPRASTSAALPANRHERRRLEALARSAQRRAA